MTTPVRLQLSRRKGFRLQERSRAVNGLPAFKVTRPGLFGNPFAITVTTPAKDAVTCFRRFLRSWSDTKIFEGIRSEDGAADPVGGLGMIILRNRIRANIWRLRGHNPACWCAHGQPCHADVYIDLLATDWPEIWRAKYPKLCAEVKP